MADKTNLVSQRIRKALLSFGLSENETKVYKEALKQKESSPFTLSKATGIPRTTVYDTLMNLSLKGLVKLQQSDGFTKQQTKVKAENPSVLRQILRNKRKELTKTEVDILEILPLLKEEFHGEEANADFQFFPGIEGVRKIILSEDDDGLDIPLYAFDNLMPMDAFGTKDIDEDVDRANAFRTKAKFKLKELVVLNDWTRHVVSYQYNRDKRYIKAREMRYVDNPLLTFNLRIAIKGTRIMISCAQDEEVWGLVINSKALSQTLLSVFQFLWIQAKEITDEVVKSWGEDEYVEFERLYKSKKK